MIRRNLSLLFLLALFGLVGPQRVATQDFKGIIPLISTKADVEKILGSPNEFGRYELPEGRVYVSYLTVGCKPEQKTCRCKAPLGTVSEISLTFNDDIFLSTLHLDPRFWTKFPNEGHIVGEYTYSNAELGLTYWVLDGIVRDIVYHESSATCSKLMRARTH